VEIRPITYGSTWYYQALGLRDFVLRRPLGLFFTSEDLQSEVPYHHFIGTYNGWVIATAQWVDIGNKSVKMRQVAIHPDFQQLGFGKKLVNEMEVWAIKQGYHQAHLHARETAVPFYQKLSYQIEGEPFEEVGIAHFKMKKNFSS
jgi:predicted GNAT family N-acyltransferase